MKTNSKILPLIGGTALAICLLEAPIANALPIGLGVAGPGNFALLEIGSGANVSGAAAPPSGYINGNVGIASGSSITTSAGNFPIKGSVELGTTASADSATAANATGGIVQNAASQTLLAQAVHDAQAASAAAAALAASGGGVGVSSITSGGTLTPGVYDLSSLNLPNNAVLTLSAGGYYVFNISGTLALHSSQILAANGLSVGEILFNVTGTQGVAFSGGLNSESILDGIILAPNASVSITPGYVDGEIISGKNINIASGGSVNNNITVPDGGSTAMLLGLACGLVGIAQRKIRGS
jgi:hypothetical protein